MKKIVYLSLFGVLLLNSCSEGENDINEDQRTILDICDCAQAEVDMIKEWKEADGDEAKIKAIEESYKADKEACTKLMEDITKEMEGMSNEEKKAKGEEMMKEMESCDASKENMKLREAFYSAH